MDRGDESSEDRDATDEVNIIANRNKPVNQVDNEIQTHDDESSQQDLFDSSADITTLTQTPKIGTEESNPYQPTVPTIPKSLVPFISTVNESWTSELETPQAKTAAGINLHFTEGNETMERKRCDSLKINGVIPDVTTPIGYFVNRVEDEGFPTSPTLDTKKKRRRPKRRILKSLNDTTIPTDSFKEIGNACNKFNDDNASNIIETLESETTLPKNDTSSVNDATFVVDANCSIHNSNVKLIRDEINNEEIDPSIENQSAINNFEDSILIVSDEEEADCLMNERLQSSAEFENMSLNDTVENEKEIAMRNLESANEAITDFDDFKSDVNKADDKSIAELVKEIKELEEINRPVTEHKYADIPMEVFTRGAKALENADTTPIIIPKQKSKVNKQWGLISFTQMCLLEQENYDNEDKGVKETEEFNSTMKNTESSHHVQEDKLATAEFAAPALKSNRDISFHASAEPGTDIDVLSQWFSDEESEFSTNTNVADNMANENTKIVKSGWEIPINQKIVSDKERRTAAAVKDEEKYIDWNTLSEETASGNNQWNKKMKSCINPPQSFSSIGFSTAGGNVITIAEDKIKKAQKLYDQIDLRDVKLWNNTGEYKTENKENKAAIAPNSYNSIRLSSTSRKPMNFSKDRTKASEKLYEGIPLQDGKRRDAKMLNEIVGDFGTVKKESETAAEYKNSYSLKNFDTAGEKAIKISEVESKEAAKKYNGVNVTDETQPTAESLGALVSHGVKRKLEEFDINCYNQTCGANSSAGFQTASGKPLSISKTAIKRARTMYQSIDLSESHNAQDKDSKKELTHFVGRGKNVSSKKNHDNEDVTGFKKSPEQENTVFNVEHSEQLELKNLPESTWSNNLIKKLRQTDKARDRRLQILDRKELLSRKHDLVDHTVAKSIPTAFSMASSKAIKISNKVSSNGENLLDQEQNSSVSVHLSCGKDNRDALAEFLTDDCKLTEIQNQGGSIRFSTANGESSRVLQQKNTSPSNSLPQVNNVAIETCSNVSVSKTPACKSLSENISSEETPVGVSIFQSSKRIRFNPDLQARKLFDETVGEEDEETEYKEQSDIDNKKEPRTPLNSNKNFAHHLLSHKRNRNHLFIKNSTPGLLARSDMFEANDRLGVPELEAQKSSPLIQEIEDIQRREKLNNRLAPVRKDRRMSTYSDEITASAEALLADEENSFDGKIWGSAITCSPTMIEDRDISVKPITLGGDNIQEPPTSPIIGGKTQSRKKIKRKKRSLLKRDTCIIVNEGLEEKIVDQDSRQSSGVATSTLESLKDSEKRMSNVIDTALVSKLKKLEETLKSIEASDVELENLKLSKKTQSEIDDKEAIECLFENRLAARLEQEKRIRAKKRRKSKPIPGNLFIRKMENRESRVSLIQATNGVPPSLRTSQELIDLGIGLDVTEVTASTALSYKFKCLDFYSKDEIRDSVNGLDIGDGGRLIFNENGYAGVVEFEQAFIASPGVDPTLLPQKWVENHYRWIVWKLASMDRMKFENFSYSRILTPRNVMEQLKYRYDREIDKSERPALRRIIEKDDPPCRRMILCVATITKIENIQSSEKISLPISNWKVELTDGWYSVIATIDLAMAHFIASGKVREGTKLVTCRAELLNCEQGCFPLEIPAEVSLKIHTNSTRRSRWDAKLGYCKYAAPINTSISSILQYGGLIGKLSTTIARVYPIQYYEKTRSGQSVFRNNKCEDKAVMMYEKERQAQIDAIYAQVRSDFEARNRRHSKIYSSSNFSKSFKQSLEENGSKICRDRWNDDCDLEFEQQNLNDEEAFRNEVESMLRDSLPPPRKVTLVLKVRLMEGDDIAVLTIWSPSEDFIDVIKEGNSVSIHNVQTSSRRSGELHLTAGHQSFVKLEKSKVSYSLPKRCLTSIPEVAVAGFNPPFGEFDTVGIVVSLGPAPHGMKNFEVVNLACPMNSEGSDSAYLSILFWEGIGAYGFSDILSVGATVACTNLQWRRGAPRTIPMAYSTENSTFTRNPRQIYLRSAFDSVKNQITDLLAYTSQCASEIATEHQKKSTFGSPAVQGTPNKVSPHPAAPVQDKFAVGVSPRTPQGLVNQEVTTPAKYSIQRRLEKLQWYGEPPELSPISLNHSSPRVNQKFVPLVRTFNNTDCASGKKDVNVKK